MNKEQTLNNAETQQSNIASDSGRCCEWKVYDFGMMGFHDYEYVTRCGKNYDCNNVNKENYCPNCGGKIV